MHNNSFIATVTQICKSVGGFNQTLRIIMNKSVKMYHRSVPVVWCRKRRPPRFLAFAHATLRKAAAAAAVSGQPSGAMRAVGDDQRCRSKVLHICNITNNHTANNRMGGFICTFSLLISLSITLRSSKFRNQFTISSKYFDMACYL